MYTCIILYSFIMLIVLTHKTQISFNSPADGQLTHVLYNLYFLLFPSEKHTLYYTYLLHWMYINILYYIFLYSWYKYDILYTIHNGYTLWNKYVYRYLYIYIPIYIGIYTVNNNTLIAVHTQTIYYIYTIHTYYVFFSDSAAFRRYSTWIAMW